jgi:hypothetical protein
VFLTGVGAAAELGRLSSLLFREAVSLSERGLYQQTARFAFQASFLARDAGSAARLALVPGQVVSVGAITAAAAATGGSDAVAHLNVLDFLPVTGSIKAGVNAFNACK